MKSKYQRSQSKNCSNITLKDAELHCKTNKHELVCAQWSGFILKTLKNRMGEKWKWNYWIDEVEISKVQCWQLETDPSILYVINWYISRRPDRCYECCLIFTTTETFPMRYFWNFKGFENMVGQSWNVWRSYSTSVERSQWWQIWAKRAKVL